MLQLVQLMESHRLEVSRLEAQNAKLQQENGELKTYVDSLRQDYEVYRDQRDLEQQAKGVEDALYTWRNCTDSNIRVNMKFEAEKLRNQAKGESK